MNIEQYVVPTTIEEAVQLLADGNVTVFAGGTDLMPQAQAGRKAFQPVLMNLNRIDEMKDISVSDNSIIFGARTTVTEVLESDILKKHASILLTTADRFASGQIRNAATLGGNICNASPAGDMIIPLLLLDAVVELASWDGRGLSSRRIPLAAFFLGPGKTVMLPHELLTAITFSIPPENFVARFEKFGTRPALDISIVSIGIAGVRENGGLKKTRVACGAVAPIPLRCRKVEAAIESDSLSEDRIEDIAMIAESEISPIDDVRATAWYRKEITRTLTRRILHDIREARI